MAESLSARTNSLITSAHLRHGNGLAISCSFSLEDIVVLNFIAPLKPQPKVFVLDTGRLPEATYQVLEACRNRFGIEFQHYFPKHRDVESLLQSKGALSFLESVANRQECCHIRKVEPLNRALQGATGWITGLRRSQSPGRSALQELEIDETHGGIEKLNPLANWEIEDVWEVIRKHNLPYNRLYDQGYTSIGCAPCTRAIVPGESIRAGRWWWENPESKECGLHVAAAGGQ